jgi:hypothetical protein
MTAENETSQEEKMRRFNQVMREKFGVKWDLPARTETEEDGALPKGSGDGLKQTMPNRKENEFMMNLMILRNALKVHGPAMEARAKRAGPTVWRDIRMMGAVIDRIMDALQNTMPPERDEYYRAYARNGHYELKMNGPIRHEGLVLVSDRKLAAVYEAAMESECLTCLREGKEIGNCLLRACFLETIPTTTIQEEGRWKKCEYEDVARSLVKGEEIFI